MHGLRRLFGAQAFTWKIVQKDTPRQLDGYNCGMFLYLYIRFLVEGLEPQFISAEIDSFWRPLTFHELVQGQMMPLRTALALCKSLTGRANLPVREPVL